MTRPPGRPRTLHEVHVMRGTRDHHPPGPKGSRPTRRPAVPPTLHTAGRRAWQLYWQHGRPWLAETDRPTVERLCGLIDDLAAIRAVVEAEGLMIVNPATGRSHPHAAHNHLLGISRAIERLESSLGFDPASRQRLRMERKDDDDPLAAWLAAGASPQPPTPTHPKRAPTGATVARRSHERAI